MERRFWQVLCVAAMLVAAATSDDDDDLPEDTTSSEVVGPEDASNAGLQRASMHSRLGAEGMYGGGMYGGGGGFYPGSGIGMFPEMGLNRPVMGRYYPRMYPWLRYPYDPYSMNPYMPSYPRYPYSGFPEEYSARHDD